MLPLLLVVVVVMAVVVVPSRTKLFRSLICRPSAVQYSAVAVEQYDGLH